MWQLIYSIIFDPRVMTNTGSVAATAGGGVVLLSAGVIWLCRFFKKMSTDGGKGSAKSAAKAATTATLHDLDNIEEAAAAGARVAKSTADALRAEIARPEQTTPTRKYEKTGKNSKKK